MTFESGGKVPRPVCGMKPWKGEISNPRVLANVPKRHLWGSTQTPSFHIPLQKKKKMQHPNVSGKLSLESGLLVIGSTFYWFNGTKLEIFSKSVLFQGKIAASCRGDSSVVHSSKGQPDSWQTLPTPYVFARRRPTKRSHNKLIMCEFCNFYKELCNVFIIKGNYL